jgi:uncharacterized protein
MQHGLIERRRLLDELAVRCAEAPVTVLLGARQVGKTTLARMFCRRREDVAWYDLETSSGMESLRAMPEKTLGGKRGLVVLDEVQRMPELFRILRPLCDREGVSTRFLLLGSASPELMRGVSETLAGRAQFLHVPGLTVGEAGAENQDRLWMRGGFSSAYLAQDTAAAGRWQESFVQTFLERDIPQLGIRVSAAALRRFWTMAAHYHGQVLNLADMGRVLGVSPATARHYLDILCGSYAMRQLQPWFENLGKRQVKSPKLYFRDSGLLHHFLGTEDMDGLLAHPRLGASWEGFALEQVLALVGERDAYFWATQRGAELDLLVFRKGKRYGFEFKASDAPRLTPSMRIAVENLKLERLWVLHPAESAPYALADKVEAYPLRKWTTHCLGEDVGAESHPT